MGKCRGTTLCFGRIQEGPETNQNASGDRTKREADVARRAVEGLFNREIARKLDLVEHAVKNYLSRIFDELATSPMQSLPSRAGRHSAGNCRSEVLHCNE